MNESISQKIYQFSDKISEIQQKLILNTNPLNHLEEKTKFLNSKVYNPTFIYSEYIDRGRKTKLIEIKDELQTQTFPEIYINYFNELIDYFVKFENLIANKGKGDFYRLSEELLLWDVNLDIDKYKQIANSFDTFNEELYGYEEIEKEFKQYLYDKYDLKDWRIVIVEDSTRILVIANKNLIKIGKNAKKTKRDMKRLVVHEIDTHVLRKYNGLNQKLSILGKTGLPNYVLIEEGFAVFNEFFTKTITKKSLDSYILRYETVLNGGSFREIFSNLMDRDISLKEAYDLAFRIKRGGGDTSSKEVFKRDSAYLAGYDLLDELMKKEPQKNIIKYLFSGKVGLREIDTFETLISTQNLLLPEYYLEYS